jgi:hypothetical protein
MKKIAAIIAIITVFVSSTTTASVSKSTKTTVSKAAFIGGGSTGSKRP